MELQINDLVSAIKKDGVDTANKEAESIISSAKKQAATIVSAAQSEASKLKEDAEKEINVFKESARNNAEQAKRDAVLAFKSEVQGEFEKLLSSNVNKALDENLLGKLILTAVAGEDVSGYAVEVKEVSEGLKAQLAEEIKKGLEIRVSKNVRGGFKLAAKDGSGYFDCTDDEITSMLMPFFRDLIL